ncbi:C2 calcium-dependent membrane targeting domain containing protein [Trichostrongylus colubriformis]|uniref:C2 calcium-dependent membrane targeting domain containing protein n=1 Tax=Trichostrongylus colubriformis TaxID=6319 RepID=A0AAN8FD26_TRICO
MQKRQAQSVPTLNKEHDCYDAELHVDSILTHLSFIRINIDNVVLAEENPFIERLYNEGSLYGFNLEYKFPCLENVSRSLTAPVRIPAKSFTMTNIQFRHRRVVLLQMNPDIVPFWNRHHLVIRLHVQLNTRGKFSTRMLGHCVVPLAELLIPPFMICRDFSFIPNKGMTFEGSSLIRIDLGSREKKLSEKLNDLRDPLLESTYVVDGISNERDSGSRNRSRAASLDRSSHGNENRPPRILPSQACARAHGETDRYPERGIVTRPVPFRERVPSNLTDLSDSVFEEQNLNYGVPRPFASLDSDPRRAHHLDSRREFRPAVRSSTSSSIKERERESPRTKCLIQLTVHEAHGLPPVRDERNRLVSPNAYVSVLGRDGELRSSICERSRRPLWNWTARFQICGERRNIIVKILHHDSAGDMTLGFVSIPLPIEEAHRVDYEMVDLTGKASLHGEVPILTMSMEASDVARYPRNVNRAQSSSSTWSEQQVNSTVTSSPLRSVSAGATTVRPSHDEYLITATREELEEKLRRNLSDLDRMIKIIKE